MPKFNVIMKEVGSDGKIRTIEQQAICPTRQKVIDWYGLNEPDIIEYKIEEVED